MYIHKQINRHSFSFQIPFELYSAFQEHALLQIQIQVFVYIYMYIYMYIYIYKYTNKFMYKCMHIYTNINMPYFSSQIHGEV
jgi:hypothetical protein